MNDPVRMMVYSQDSYGLGHLRRTTNIANAMVGRRQDVTVLLTVDSPVAPFFDLGDRIDFVKLPTVVKVDAGKFRAGQLSTSYDRVRTLRSNVIREVTMQYRPHLLLVDHMPGGANRELVPTLDLIRQEGLPTRIVMGLRDIIDRPDVTKGVWKREGVYDTIAKYYDSVIIYGESEVYPTADEYGISTRCCPNIKYGGYVCNQTPPKEPARIREKLGLADEPIVAVMAGGGADAFRVMQAYLDGAKRLAGRRFATVMVTGPFMPEEQRRALKDQAREQGVKIHTSVGDTLSHINAAEVVVSMAGYNTVLEILRFGRKAILVPRPGPSAEQTMRASILHDRGLVRMVHPDDLSADTIADRLVEALDADPGANERRLPGLDGVDRVAEALLGSLPGENGHVPEVITLGDRLRSSPSRGSAAS